MRWFRQEPWPPWLKWETKTELSFSILYFCQVVLSKNKYGGGKKPWKFCHFRVTQRLVEHEWPTWILKTKKQRYSDQKPPVTFDCLSACSPHINPPIFPQVFLNWCPSQARSRVYFLLSNGIKVIPHPPLMGKLLNILSIFVFQCSLCHRVLTRILVSFFVGTELDPWFPFESLPFAVIAYRSQYKW